MFDSFSLRFLELDAMDGRGEHFDAKLTTWTSTSSNRAGGCCAARNNS